MVQAAAIEPIMKNDMGIRINKEMYLNNINYKCQAKITITLTNNLKIL